MNPEQKIQPNQQFECGKCNGSRQSQRSKACKYTSESREIVFDFIGEPERIDSFYKTRKIKTAASNIRLMNIETGTDFWKAVFTGELLFLLNDM